MSKLNAAAAEVLVRKIARDGRCFSTVPLKRSQILDLVKLHVPQRYKNVVAGMKRAGCELPEQCSKTVTVDQFLGIDCVIDIDGCLIGIDVTTNDNAVDEKLCKLSRLKDTLQACSIEHVIVLYLDINKTITDDDETIIFFNLLDNAEMLIEQERWSTLVEVIME